MEYIEVITHYETKFFLFFRQVIYLDVILTYIYHKNQPFM